MQLAKIYRALAKRVDSLKFNTPVTHVYNPLQYARKPFEKYLELYGNAPKKVVLVGMNPGPFGMAQTGVPFGDRLLVQDFLGIDEPVGKPPMENPKRPVLGFDCPRREVSGSRLWGWAQERFGTPQNFFQHFFVLNYCPLVLMEKSGKNFTPDKLKAKEKETLFQACDHALAAAVQATRAHYAIGVGKFAEQRLMAALDPNKTAIGSILHPSPASPLANQGWSDKAEQQLLEIGIDVQSMSP